MRLTHAPHAHGRARPHVLAREEDDIVIKGYYDYDYHQSVVLHKTRMTLGEFAGEI
jgi:hypothetical protein